LTPRDLRYRAVELLGRERGTVTKPRGGRTTVCLAYPNTYYVGMSSLGFQTVYRIINDRTDALAERVFMPEPPELERLIKSGKPLSALESRTPAAGFDLLAFSVSFENDYVNVAEMLRLCKLPPLAKDRGAGHPLVLLGGVTSFFNPEPIAPFFDAVIIGEAEEALPEFLDAFSSNRHKDRPALLSALAGIPGVYVPSLYTPEYNSDGTLAVLSPERHAPAKVVRRHVADLDSHPAHSVILTPETEFSDMYMVELSRGCGRHCRFCMAGYVYRPPRHRSLKSVKLDVLEGKELTGKIGLVGAAVSDYPEVAGLVESFTDLEIGFSASSLRADSLTPELVSLISKRNRSVAIAPEAGSQRLRSVINKNITEEQILGAVKMLIYGGVLNVKLYFMVGLPTETDKDVDEIVELGMKARGAMLSSAKKKGRIGTLTLSVNCFIPKPWTPFQWEAMEEVEALNAKVRRIKKALKGTHNVSVIHDVPKWAYLQGALARGDRRLAGVILRASEGEPWPKSFKAEGLEMSFFAGRTRVRDELFPWDFIDTGVDKGYLWKEHERAGKGKRTPPCRVGKCRTCGVC
jgi:radical SAM family uncharacterized protein